MTRPRKKELLLIGLPASENFFLQAMSAPFLKDLVPTSLLILAALTPRDYKITFINQRIFWRKEHFPADVLVGITCYTPQALRVYALAERFRSAGATVVLGGPHVTALPEEAAQHADGVVLGEAESVWPQVIKDYEAGTLQKVYQGVPLEDYFSPVFPYFKTLPAKWLSATGIGVTRGCKFRCEFCTPGAGKPRHMSLEQAVEMSRLVGSKQRSIQYGESNIYNDPAFSRELFRALIPLQIKWCGFSAIDIAFDPEALELARKSGCQILFIGIETVRPMIFRKNSIGGIRTIDDYIRALQAIRSHGIQVKGSFIIGLDQFTHQDYWQLLGFFVRTFVQCPFLSVAIGIYAPFPGSATFERLKREGRLLVKRWDSYDLPWRVQYVPKTMPRWAVSLWWFILHGASFCLSTIGLLLLCIVVLLVVLAYVLKMAHPLLFASL